MEVGDALRIDLGAPCADVVAPQQELRQHPHAAPHLQHVAGGGGMRVDSRRAGRVQAVGLRAACGVARMRSVGLRADCLLLGAGRGREGRLAARERVADLARDIEVDQKMLAQRFLCSYFGHNRVRSYGKRSTEASRSLRNLNRTIRLQLDSLSGSAIWACPGSCCRPHPDCRRIFILGRCQRRAANSAKSCGLSPPVAAARRLALQ